MNLYLVLQNAVYAAESGVNTTVTSPVGTNLDTLSEIFGFIVNLAIGVGWSLVLVMLAIGFIMYILSKGEKVAVENAQKWITYAVIGGAGLFFVMVIRNLIPGLLGANNIDVGGNVTIP